MDDWLDSVFDEPILQQDVDHHQLNDDVNDDLEAAEGMDCLSRTRVCRKAISSALLSSKCNATRRLSRCKNPSVYLAGIRPAEVLTRIKATIFSFLEELFEHNSVPDISVVMSLQQDT